LGSQLESIYLDNAATTRPDKEVIEAMNRAMNEGFGNPSSLYGIGLKAAEVVRDAMETIERAIGGGPWRVVFTSGGSESNTMAVLGTVPKGKRDKVITTTVEHAAVIESCRQVENLGGRFIQVGAGEGGVVDPKRVIDAVDDQTALVTAVHVAPEIGTVQPVEEIAKLLKAKVSKCLIHVDAVQAFTQLPALNYPAEVDMISLSAHKIHGPMGVGALLLRPNVKPRPIVCGGDQQGRLRPGTLNVPGIVGFQTAVRLVTERRVQGATRMKSLADRLIQDVVSETNRVRTLGDSQKRAPGMVVLAARGVKSEVLLHTVEAKGLLASSGSACHSTRTDPPQALKDAGLRPDEGVLRLSLSFDTTPIEIDRAVAIIREAINSIRNGRVSQ
jgi:cysteine desulfurase